jgi:hypothetical protein
VRIGLLGMRRILITLLIVILTMSILWIFAGRQISRFVDEIKTKEIESKPVHSITYEGSGDGGSLVIDGDRWYLAPLNPHVGSTKDNQLALAHGGKVFTFGPLRSPDVLTTEVSQSDRALLVGKKSFIGWPTHRFSTELNWTKQDDVKLKMIWALDRSQDEVTTQLIQIDISNPAR